MADLTLVNLNMLYMRQGEKIDRERHVPLGCLYLTRALENAGLAVDFRDYQQVASDDPFDLQSFLAFLDDPAPFIGLSCMANLLPFTLVAAEALKKRYPERPIILGGVGTTAVEAQVLARFPWIDIIVRGEAERTGVELLQALKQGQALSSVKGISYRKNGSIHHNPDRERIRQLDTIAFPAFDKIDLSQYVGYGMMTSRGCPYPCTFCSVAPIWRLESHSRSVDNIVAEMAFLHRQAGVTLFLFQDEFFVSGKTQVMDFCKALRASGLEVKWKAFGRVNLMDEEMMQAMTDCGCIELRFGIESGSDRVLKIIKKGFTAAQALELIPKAVKIMPRVDTFFIWGFPFETLDDFNQTLFQMISFRMLGARILPSLLSLLPQTTLYKTQVDKERLEFCPYLLPEFVYTGHENFLGARIEIPTRYRTIFELIKRHPDIFPGFYHIDLAGNVLPKLKLLQQFGFYPMPQGEATVADNAESCGAHSPHVAPPDLATRTQDG